MVLKININCDVGEGMQNEVDLFPYIQSCNIACGGHAGSDIEMCKIVKLAVQYDVKIGAHPSYPDRENFGRKSMTMSAYELKETIQLQINSLKVIAEELGGKLHHIKAHGALYNDLVKDTTLSEHFLKAIEAYKSNVKLYVPNGSKIENLALKQGFSILNECFADRNYNEDLSLVSRTELNALIVNPQDIFEHVSEIVTNNRVTAISGKKVPIKVATFCIHSDTKNAVEIVKYLHSKTQKKN